MDFKRTLLAAALPFAFTLSSAAHALEIKFADIHPAGYPTVVAEEQLGKTLVADSDGKLTFKDVRRRCARLGKKKWSNRPRSAPSRWPGSASASSAR
jgi:hypothetical protein